jgi:endonuclease/exonuclease/phosphatase family metal-dependent hydrolase
MTTHLEYYSAGAARGAGRGAARAPCRGRRPSRRDRPHDTSRGPFHSQPQAAAAILTGDFNFRPEDPLRARIAAPFDDPDVPPLDDVWHAAARRSRTRTPAACHDRAQWPESFACDFVFATRDLRERLRSIAVDAVTNASDHQPIVVDIGEGAVERTSDAGDRSP